MLRRCLTGAGEYIPLSDQAQIRRTSTGVQAWVRNYRSGKVDKFQFQNEEGNQPSLETCLLSTRYIASKCRNVGYAPHRE